MDEACLDIDWYQMYQIRDSRIDGESTLH